MTRVFANSQKVPWILITVPAWGSEEREHREHRGALEYFLSTANT